MPFGQIVIGPPGSGKSTYCHGLQQFFKALERSVHIVNLDPANDMLPYECALNITELVSLQDVMQEYGLGPNGGMIYCLEYLEQNFDWLQEGLQKLKGDYIVFDMPGQVELSTNHDSLRNIIRKLDKLGYRLAAVNLVDSFHVTDASKYIAILLLSLRTMLQLELPHVNVLSKIDLITKYGDLPFNLDYYTEVQDLEYLQYELDKDPRTATYGALNKAICEIVEDFGLVGFQTLCVEDKMSMAALVRQIDQMLGCVPKAGHADRGDSEDAEAEAEDAHQHQHSAPKTPSDLLHSLPRTAFPTPADIQERYVDYPEEYAEHERAQWKEEGEAWMKKATELEKERAVLRAKRENERIKETVGLHR